MGTSLWVQSFVWMGSVEVVEKVFLTFRTNNEISKYDDNKKPNKVS